MPRYFFDILRDGQELHDEEGSDLTDDRMAEREAIGILQDMTRSLALDGDGDTIRALVRNASASVIFRAKMVLTTQRIGSA